MNKKLLLLLPAFVIALIPFVFEFGMAFQAQIVFSIVLFIAFLWITETFPLWVTAFFIPALLILFAGFTPNEAFNPFFDSIIALLFGGFVLARAIQKYGLDVKIADFFIGFYGNNPRKFMIGLMFATAFLSFWISNTASALLMIPIGLAALKATGLKIGSSYGKALVLGIGFAATIGGTGTLIGSPPNLIAAKFIAETGSSISFAEWMFYALPGVVFLLIVSWFVLLLFFKPEVEAIRTPFVRNKKLSKNQKWTLLVFAVTAFLWFTESIHGVHNSVVAMVPVFSFFGSGLLKREDLGKIGWGVLILVGGSLSLGLAMQSSGLSYFISDSIAFLVQGKPLFIVYFMVCLVAIIVTSLGTNTGSAAVMIPVVAPLAPVIGVSPRILSILIGIVVSYSLIFPTGTPPNTIAYGTGYIRILDMVKTGVVISFISIIFFSFIALFW